MLCQLRDAQDILSELCNVFIAIKWGYQDHPAFLGKRGDTEKPTVGVGKYDLYALLLGQFPVGDDSLFDYHLVIFNYPIRISSPWAGGAATRKNRKISQRRSLMFSQIPLALNCGHTPAAGSSNCLSEDVVPHISAGKYARDRGLRAVWIGD